MAYCFHTTPSYFHLLPYPQLWTHVLTSVIHLKIAKDSECRINHCQEEMVQEKSILQMAQEDYLICRTLRDGNSDDGMAQCDTVSEERTAQLVEEIQGWKISSA